MSELEKAAREYAEGLRSADKKNTYDNIEVDSSRMVAFKRGTEWQANQSPWISVEMAVPGETSKGTVMVRNIRGEEWDMPARKVYYWVYPYLKTNYITHWRPIPE